MLFAAALYAFSYVIIAVMRSPPLSILIRRYAMRCHAADDLLFSHARFIFFFFSAFCFAFMLSRCFAARRYAATLTLRYYFAMRHRYFSPLRYEMIFAATFRYFRRDDAYVCDALMFSAMRAMMRADVHALLFYTRARYTHMLLPFSRADGDYVYFRCVAPLMPRRRCHSRCHARLTSPMPIIRHALLECLLPYDAAVIAATPIFAYDAAAMPR